MESDLRLSPEGIVKRLNLQPGASFSDVAAAVVALYRKPLCFEGLSDAGWGVVTGLLLDQKEMGLILYRRADPPLYQLHCVLHEIGHVLLGEMWCASAKELGGSLFQGGTVHKREVGDVVDAEDPKDIERAAEDIAYLLAKHLHTGSTTFSRIFA